MRKIMLILTVIMTVCAAQSAQAKGGIPITYGEHEKIEQVGVLPDEIKADDGTTLVLGHKYTVFEILFVPLWTTDQGKLVGYNPNEADTFYDIDVVLENEEGKAAILSLAGVSELSELHKIPFWDAWGGKIVGLLVIALILYGVFGRESSSKKSSEPAPAIED